MNTLSHDLWLSRFEEHLREKGFRQKTIQRALAATRRFLHYLQNRAVSIDNVGSDILDDFFISQLRQYQQRYGRTPEGVNHWHHLFNRGVTGFLRFALGQWPPGPTPTNDREEFHRQICDDYAQWLADTRGLAPATIISRRSQSQHFLAWLGEHASRDNLQSLSVKEIDAWLMTKFTHSRRSTRAEQVHSLRSFLRYLHTQGLIVGDLAATLTAPSLYAFESIPSAIKSEDILTVLQCSKQDQTPRGLRDFAILTLLATYGLRAGEIVSLRLEDIDWRHEHLLIRHTKTQGETLLPLMPEVADAVINYLRKGRPQTPSREIFFRVKAPHQPFQDGSSLHTLVTRRLERAGIKFQGKHGPHAFRHARAISLLRADVSLKAIGDILGHRAITSTTGYLRLAMEDMRSIGLEVPSIEEVQR
jgi:integrase/recombinase XerD